VTRSVWIESLGCPKNEVDGESVESLLEEKGYKIVRDQREADILILNTCGFVQAAKEESIEELFRLITLKNQDESKKIIVCGCLPQRYPIELWEQLPEVDAFLGLSEGAKVHSACAAVLEGERILRVGEPGRGQGVEKMRRRAKGSPFAYIKIADGCDNHCSYCAIPAIRGGFRSKRLRHVLEEARELAEQGVKEINLVAQDTTLYGADLYSRQRLPQLLSSLSKIGGLEWIRLLYTHPAHFTDELIEEIASNPKVCKYVDLPLQHIADDILKKMNRRVRRKKVEQLISRLRERISGLTLRTSFIVGFPGETKRQFGQLLEFVEQIKFDKLGAFAYSREEGTKAYRFKGQVPAKVKQERLDQLMLAQQRIVLENHESRIGKTCTVIIDGESNEGKGFCLARSQAEAPEVDGAILVRNDHLRAGQLVEVEIVGYSGYDLMAEVIGPERSREGCARRRNQSLGQKNV
jgi:ribosomal protein S12 methylthiotransferase